MYFNNMIPLIDTHLHLIYREQASYSWTKEINEIANSDFPIEDYKKLTKSKGIGGSIFMETGVDDSSYKDEIRFVNSLKEDSDNNIIGIISSIRPENNKEFDVWLEETLEIGVVGYRRILHVMPDETSKSKIFRDNVNKIGNAGKPFDMCFLSKQLSIALELAKSCEKTQLVLNHCGVPNIAEDEIDTWKKDIKLLSEVPNIVCKLSGLMAYCSPGTSSYDKIEPYVDCVLDYFGPKRMVWGSDWPVVNLGRGLPEWIEVTRKIFQKLTYDEAKAIAYYNAQEIYKVNL